MVEYEVEELIEQIPSKYALVVAVARRARQLVASDDLEGRERPVSRALAEIAQAARDSRALEGGWPAPEDAEAWPQGA
jgi:DNA-directed RNA polymerase omega subunit